MDSQKFARGLDSRLLVLLLGSIVVAVACASKGTPATYGKRSAGTIVAVSLIVVGDTRLGSLPMLQTLCSLQDGVAIKKIEIDAWGPVLRAASGTGQILITLNKGECVTVPAHDIQFDGRMQYEKLRRIDVSVFAEMAGRSVSDRFTLMLEH